MASEQLEKVLFVWCYLVNIRRLSTNIRREICRYLKPCCRLVGVQDGYLTFYTFPGNRKRKVSHSHPFAPGTMHCWVNSTDLLFVGSGSFFETCPLVPDVYSLNTQDCTVTPHPSLLQARCRPGLICVRGTVYVFGGGSGFAYFRTCEQWPLTENSWFPMPEMKQARCIFSPVLHCGLIYLPDVVNSSGVLEAYDTVKNTFEVVNVLLPSLSQPSLAFRVEDTLMVISETAWWSWKIGETDSCKRYIQLDRKMSSSCPPEILEGKVYWLETHTGQLACLTLADLKDSRRGRKCIRIGD